MDILITEPLNEKDDDNIVPDGLFNLTHERPPDQSRASSPVNHYNDIINSDDLIKATSQIISQSLKGQHQSFNTSMSRSRPATPSSKSNANSCNNSRPPSPLPTMTTAPRSRPASPSSSSSNNTQNNNNSKRGSLMGNKAESIPEIETNTNFIDPFHPLAANTINVFNTNDTSESKPQDLSTTNKLKFNKKKKNRGETRTYYSSSQGVDIESSSSLSDDDDDDVQLIFQIRIRPKSQKISIENTQTAANAITLGGGGGGGVTPTMASTPTTFVPLLPRPPRSAQEIEEFRQRRYSSENGGSTTRSIKNGDDEESSDDDGDGNFNNRNNFKVKKVK